MFKLYTCKEHFKFLAFVIQYLVNDFIVTNVNVIVNLLSKHCAEIILRLYILLRFYSSYYSSYISTAWSAYKGVGGGGRRIYASAIQ